MAATVTPISIPASAEPGGQTYKGIFSLLLDTTDTDGNIEMDLTEYFKYVDAVFVGDVDTLADAGYHFRGICPTRTTELAADNLFLNVRDEALAIVASTDLSAIGALKIEVYGRRAQ